MTGRIEKGVLTGDLVIRGGNDPVLTWARLDDLVKRLRKRGIDTIQGNIIIDRGLCLAPEDETRMFAGEMALPFNSPPDSLIVNGKTVTVRFVPDTRTRSVVLSVEPPLDAVHIRGTLAYAAGPCAGQQSFVDAEGSLDYARIRVDGVLPLGCGLRSVTVSVLGHPEYFQRAFAQL